MSQQTSPSVPGQKVVLITGATSGIGQACANHLSGRGWRVFGTRRGSSSASANGTPFEMITMDVDNDASVQAGVETLLSKVGRLDAVVNNAGFSLMGPIEHTSTEEAKAQMETNFFGVLRVCRATLPALRQQGGGHIVNVSSLAAVVGLPFSGLYSASKFALEGLSESLRHETRPFGVRVVLVEPGDFRTPITAKRRTTQASAANDTYRSAFEQFKLKQDQDEAQAPDPLAVAQLIEAILRNPRPRMRYSVGMMGQRIVVPLKRFLPQALFEWLFRRVVGL
jgi:NAD(P)-dependent dehydrogenase (short-subunit alcohol dehydrogenase family)